MPIRFDDPIPGPNPGRCPERPAARSSVLSAVLPALLLAALLLGGSPASAQPADARPPDQNAAQEAAQEPAQVPALEAAQEPAQDPAQDQAQDAAQDPDQAAPIEAAPGQAEASSAETPDVGNASGDASGDAAEPTEAPASGEAAAPPASPAEAAHPEHPAEAGDHAEAAHGGHGPHLDGADLSIFWVLPFVGMLLSIALFPLLAAHFWEHHFGKVAIFWALAFLVPAVALLGPTLSIYTAVHTIVGEYVPFIILLLALFAIAGGIRLKGSLCGTPALNTGFLVAGSVLASLMGTTGASMLLIRPYLAASAHRRYKVHSVVFFIFLVSNIGGSLTPLGDPPLFLGFLKGVTFFWTAAHLYPQTLCMVIALLAIYFVVDSILYKKEGKPRVEGAERLGLEGAFNFLLLLGVVGLVLLSGLWTGSGEIVIWEDITYLHSNLVRDLGLLGLTWLTVAITPKAVRQGNYFTWGPIAEVAKIFGGIFLTMIPAIAILRAGTDGALRPLISLVTGPDGAPVNAAYFWLTGALSSFLDNAPTYLVFFNTAGGDARTLMDVIPQTLSAISCGAVFMGANSYIGNAPNFMVRSISEERGVRMPSFFGYLLWSCGILVPLFIILSLVFY